MAREAICAAACVGNEAAKSAFPCPTAALLICAANTVAFPCLVEEVGATEADEEDEEEEEEEEDEEEEEEEDDDDDDAVAVAVVPPVSPPSSIFSRLLACSSWAASIVALNVPWLGPLVKKRSAGLAGILATLITTVKWNGLTLSA